MTDEQRDSQPWWVKSIRDFGLPTVLLCVLVWAFVLPLQERQSRFIDNIESLVRHQDEMIRTQNDLLKEIKRSLESLADSVRDDGSRQSSPKGAQIRERATNSGGTKSLVEVAHTMAKPADPDGSCDQYADGLGADQGEP